MTKAERIHQELRIARMARVSAARSLSKAVRLECLNVARDCLAAARRYRLA